MLTYQAPKELTQLGGSTHVIDAHVLHRILRHVRVNRVGRFLDHGDSSEPFDRPQS